MISFKIPQKNLLYNLLIIFVFIVINFMLFFLNDLSLLGEMFDHDRYGTRFAHAFLNSGNIEEGIKNLPNRFPPMFGIIVSIFILIFKNSYLSWLVITQIFLTLILGLVFINLLKIYSIKNRSFYLLIFLLNPVLWSLCQLPRTAFWQLFFFGIASYYMLRYLKSEKSKDLILHFFFMSLDTLTRPTSQYIVLLYIIIIGIILLYKRELKKYLTNLKYFCLGILLYFAILCPLIINNIKNDHGFTLSGKDQMILFMLDGSQKINSTETIYDPNIKKKIREKYIKKYKLEYKSDIFKIERQKDRYYRFVKNEFISHIIMNLKNIPRIGMHSYLYFYIGFDKRIINVIDKANKVNISHFISRLLNIYFKINIILMRTFGLLGLFVLFFKKEYLPLIYIIFVNVYFALFSTFMPQARFRAPLEIILAFLAVYGFYFVMKITKERYFKMESNNYKHS